MTLERNVSVVYTLTCSVMYNHLYMLINYIYQNLSRNEFTHHDMHLNATGREKLAVFIGQNIK
jgi:hypothetical protein